MCVSYISTVNSAFSLLAMLYSIKSYASSCEEGRGYIVCFVAENCILSEMNTVDESLQYSDYTNFK